MRVITRKRLNDFATRYPDTATALSRWYKTVKENDFASFSELRQQFPAADQVGKYGNTRSSTLAATKRALVTAIHFNRRKIYIRAILTHAEYDSLIHSPIQRPAVLRPTR